MSRRHKKVKKVLERFGARLKGEIHTSLLAEVVGFSTDNGPRVTVEPVIRGELEGREFYDLPTISNIPVSYPAGGGFIITYPYEEGDVVWLTISKYPIDEWKALGGKGHEPRVFRRFDLTDSIAMLSIRPFDDPFQNVHSGAMVIGREDGSRELRIDKDGGVIVTVPSGKKIKLGSSAASDPVALSSKVIDELDGIKDALDTIATAAGTSHLYTVGEVSSDKVDAE